jgi:hypothetical protein
MSSVWHRTVCNALVEKFFSASDYPPQYAENILRLLQQLVSILATWHDLPDPIADKFLKYMKPHSENLQAKFIYHCHRQEWPVAALLLNILRMVSILIAGLIQMMRNEEERLGALEERMPSDLDEFPEVRERKFFLIKCVPYPLILSTKSRPYGGIPGVISF